MILIADNDRNMRDRLKKILTAIGYTAETSPLNADTAGRIKDADPELIISGGVLKCESEEYRVIGELREKGILQDRKLLLLTESCIQERIEYRSQETGQIICDDYCDKPVDREDLARKVGRLCSKNT